LDITIAKVYIPQHYTHALVYGNIQKVAQLKVVRTPICKLKLYNTIIGIIVSMEGGRYNINDW